MLTPTPSTSLPLIARENSENSVLIYLLYFHTFLSLSLNLALVTTELNLHIVVLLFVCPCMLTYIFGDSERDALAANMYTIFALGHYNSRNPVRILCHGIPHLDILLHIWPNAQFKIYFDHQ